MDNRAFSDISFEAFIAEDKLMGTRCRDCGATFAPPRALCVNCYSTAMEWAEMKGTGTLLAFTCIHIGAKFMQEEGFGRENPYCVGVVALEDGAKVNARLIGVDAGKPENIRIGTPLQVAFVHVGEGEGRKSYLAFKPR